MHISRSTISGKLKRLGLRRAHKPPTAKPVIVQVPKHVVTAPVSAVTVDPLHLPPPQRQPRHNYSKAELRARLIQAVRNT
ncbi:MAG: hypothetical protein P4M15_10770 [Alphaproteobacteria bacterium]|nr:hypothetical protein [Alphaproteobacteria bacterium]